jgi:hypothetical protein
MLTSGEVKWTAVAMKHGKDKPSNHASSVKENQGSNIATLKTAMTANNAGLVPLI